MSVRGESAAGDEARRAENETIFRDTNDSIRAIVADAAQPLPVVPFLCECGESQCRVLVRMTLEDYERVRASPRRFLVAPGHESDGGGPTTVVQAATEFVIIEKGGLAGEIAEDEAREGARGG